MRTTSAKYKEILASGNARKFVCTIYLTLADDTELTLTQEEIWEDSFKIETASSGTSSFDLGSAIIGKCSFTINNIEGDYDNYDFFNAEATVWVGIEGDTTPSYRMGFYTVDEPQIANGLISLELLDNMWKFDIPLKRAHITYTETTTARDIVQAICTRCGVLLGTQNFNGYDILITKEPEDADNMNCREMLQYVAMLGCNFCVISNTGALELKWYNDESDIFDRNISTKFSTDAIEITGVKTVVNGTEYSIGTDGYVIELENPLFTEDNAYEILSDYIWVLNRLRNFHFRTFEITTLADLSAEVGDKIRFKDYKGVSKYSYITNNSFSFSNHVIQCNAVSPARTLVKRYSKDVKAAVDQSREIAENIISSYDLSVQELNKLVEQSMGAFSDYDEAPNGGRIFYISNMPISKDPETGMCVFETGSIVWRMAGDVFSVSTDGGQTWVNGYDPSTGHLIVNVLSTIGLSAEWIKTGTLSVGGSQQGAKVPYIRVYDASDNLICEISNGGITMHKGIISSPDYAEVSGATYSTTGMKLDVLNKILRSPYFAIDQSGAYFRGTIQITGDIEITRGQFRPTDYYIATDFHLQFQQAEGYEGIGSAEIKKHLFTYVGGVWVEDISVTDTLTLTDDIPELSVILDHTVGQNGKDYYEINTTSSSRVTVLAKDISLAYVGQEGFRGFLQGIFEGYLKTNVGELAGFRYGQGTGGTYAGENGGFVDEDGYNFSMRDGFGRPNGALLRLYDNVFNFGNEEGHFRFFLSDSSGGGSNVNSIGIQTGGYINTIFKYNNLGQKVAEVLWSDNESIYTNDRVTFSTSDTPPALMQDGDLFFVYEN